MADHQTRDTVLAWWANHHQHSAAQVARHFNGPGRDQLPPGADLKPSTLRQWKSRHGLPPTDGSEPSRLPNSGATPRSAETDPEVAAVWISVHDINPWEQNPRINDHAMTAIAKSIARFGFGRAFVGWDSTDRRMLVVGHTARKAVLHLVQVSPVYDFQVPAAHDGDPLPCLGCGRHVGSSHAAACPKRIPPGAPGIGMIPMRWRDDWTEAEARAYAIADNKLGELSGWVDDDLARQLQELEADHGIAAAVLGVEDDELARLMALLEPDTGGGEDPGPPPPPSEPVSKLGEVYQLGPHRLVCGDCTDPAVWAALMGDEKLQMVWTDPPYGVAVNKVSSVEEAKRLHRRTDGLVIENDDLDEASLTRLLEASLTRLLEASLTRLLEASLPGAAWYVAAPAGPLHLLFAVVLSDLKVWKWTLMWVKDRFVLGRADYHHRHEPIFYGWAPGAAHYFVDDRTQDTVHECPRPARSEEHPTMKPVELVVRHVENSSKTGWLVGDAFSGSGTVMIACAMTSRRARSVEIDPRFCDVQRQRWYRWATTHGHDPGPDALQPPAEA